MVKLSSNEEKVRKVLEKFPNGIKARFLLIECNMSKTPLYYALNRLETNDLAFRGDHNLWYPSLQNVSENKKKGYLVDITQIKNDWINGQVDSAFKRVVLLVRSVNDLQKDWVKRNWNIFQELEKNQEALNQDLKTIRVKPIEYGNFNRQRRIKELKLEISKLKEQIVQEALKQWT